MLVIIQIDCIKANQDFNFGGDKHVIKAQPSDYLLGVLNLYL